MKELGNICTNHCAVISRSDDDDEKIELIQTMEIAIALTEPEYATDSNGTIFKRREVTETVRFVATIKDVRTLIKAFQSHLDDALKIREESGDLQWREEKP